MSALPVKTQVLDLDGASMDCVRFGQGERKLLVLPGLSLRSVAESARALAHMYAPLAETYEICIPDFKRPLPEPCDLPALAEDTARAIETLGLGQVDVLGVSLGGMIAQYLTLARPELVRRLVLAVTLSRSNDTFRAVARQWTEQAGRGDQTAVARLVMESTYSDAYLKRFGHMFPLLSAKNGGTVDLERFRTLAAACGGCDTYDRLGQIRCPVLVVGGREDRIVSGRASEEMAEKLGCQLYMYDGLGHSVCEEASRDFCARVLDFLTA